LQIRSPNAIGPSQAMCRLYTVTAGVALALGSAPGFGRPAQYRHVTPIPASEIGIAAVASAGLVAFGVILAWLWNRWNARHDNRGG